MRWADVRTAMVKLKNGPKSRAAGMLVAKSPGMLVWKLSSRQGKPSSTASQNPGAFRAEDILLYEKRAEVGLLSTERLE